MPLACVDTIAAKVSVIPCKLLLDLIVAPCQTEPDRDRQTDSATVRDNSDASQWMEQRNAHITLFEFSLCLSRACLGEKIVFIYKWRKKVRACTHRGNVARALRRRQDAGCPVVSFPNHTNAEFQ